MKIEDIKQNKDHIEIVDQQIQKKEEKKIGSMLRKPGLTLWEYDYDQKTLIKAKFEKINVEIKEFFSQKYQQYTVRHKVIYKQNCLYFQALHLKSAIKHLKNKHNIIYENK
jgi:hypothetical protein